MLDEYLVQSCQKVSPTRDAYGDYIDGAKTTLPCRFREISVVRRGTHSEDNDADAQMWFSASAPIEKGNIILFDGVTYQIEKITKARRLGETTIQFLKCDIKVTDVGIS